MCHKQSGLELMPQNTRRFMDLDLDLLKIFTIKTKHNTCAWWDCLFEYQKYILEHAVAPCFLRSLHISRDRLLSSPPAVFSLAARSTCRTTPHVRQDLSVHQILQMTSFGLRRYDTWISNPWNVKRQDALWLKQDLVTLYNTVPFVDFQDLSINGCICININKD